MNKSLIVSVFVSGLLASQGALAERGGPGKFMRFFDANNDGTVTMEEFDEAARTRFGRMDKDGNGSISRDEFRDYVMARRMEHKAEKLKRMDTNQDGKVTEDEFVSYKSEKAKRKFARMDENKDGNLTADEMQRCGKRRHFGSKGIFYRLDKNEDGQVTREESYNAWSTWFASIDANKDKVVTQDEVMAYRKSKWDARGK